jgi:hypothetical protein
MDRAIVERAVKALAAIGAAQQTVSEPSPVAPHSQAAMSAKRNPEHIGLALCGSPVCGGCYDVGDGRMIHPPKCGAGWVQ